MDFEWDETKRLSNIAKHDVDLVDAALIFEGQFDKVPDTRHDYGEPRWRSIGIVEGKCYVVIHTERDGLIRLISAWEGGRRDRRKHQASIAGRDTSDER